MDAIEVEVLRKEWPTRAGPLVAVDDVSLSVHTREVFGLLGPNGAGKSTLLRMLATLVAPTSGTARVCGHDVGLAPADVRRCLGYLSATSGLPAHVTCREALQLFADLQQVASPGQAVATAMERFDVASFAERRVDDLSTGMRQRLRIACATVHDPPVIFMDEPTSGLDVVASDRLLDQILEARDRGATVIFCTHVLREAHRICDRIGVITHGSLRGLGTPEELMAQTGTTAIDEAFLAIVRGHA